MDGLFEHSRDFADDVYRNIVSLRISEDLYDDLSDGDLLVSELLQATEMHIKRDGAPGIISRGFHYSTAIAYPFAGEPCMASRYGDGSYGVWYGCLDLRTTIYETAWHMQQDESGIEGLDEIIIRERAVYLVHCHAILLDISDKHGDFPQLLGEDYHFPQQVGKRVQQEGHPGLLAASARDPSGINLAAFNPDVLSNPRQHCYLNYHYDPRVPSITVQREPGKHYLEIRY